jgi:hypothetical protein
VGKRLVKDINGFGIRAFRQVTPLTGVKPGYPFPAFLRLPTVTFLMQITSNLKVVF